MTIIATFRRVVFPLFLFIWVLSAIPALAVTMDVTAGFDGVAKNGVWTPISVRLSNQSAENIEGTILITDPQGVRANLPVCSPAINLPANSEKLYHAYVRLTGYNSDFIVSLVDRGGTLAAKQVNFNAASADDRMVVSVGERSSRLAFLQGESIAPRSRPGPSPRGRTATIYAGSISPGNLPDRPAAYEGIDALVVSDLDTSAVSPAALKALSMWVASGGLLVVSTGADYKRFTGEFFTDLLPVTVTGATNITGAASLGALGKSGFPASPAAVAMSSVKPGVGRALAAENGVPLVAERTYGVGKVVFLAFDYKSSPFRDWNGQTDFWKEIVQFPSGSPIAPTITAVPNDYYSYYGGGGYGGPGGGSPDFALMRVVAQNPSVKMPSMGTIGLFLLAYLVVLVPLNYFVLKRRRRLELAWLTTPVIVIAFTAGAYAIGYTMKGGNLRLREATLIEGSSNARYARIVTDASLFSPARRSYDVRVNDPAAISQVIMMEERGTYTEADMGAKSTTIPIDMAMWSSKSLEAVSGVDLGGTVESSLHLSGGRVTGTVTNRTSIMLRNVQVGYGGTWAILADLAPGVTEQVDFKFGSAGPGYGSPGSSTPSGDLKQDLFAMASDGVRSASEPVLIATSDDAGGVFDIARNRPSADRARICVFHLSYSVGGPFVIPAGAIKWHTTDTQNVSEEDYPSGPMGPRVSFDGSGKCTFLFDIPTSAGTRITDLRVHASGDVSGVDFSIMNRDTGKWETIKAASGVHLTDAGKYVGPSGQAKVLVVAGRGYQTVMLNVSAEGVGR